MQRNDSDRLLTGLGIAVVANFNPPGSGVHYQAEVLVDRFTAEGARAIPITFQQNRYRRPFSTVLELVKYRRHYSVLCCQGFSFGNWINGAVSIVTGKLLGKPVSMVYRGGGFRRFAEQWPWAILPLLRRIDALIAPSEYLEREFVRYGLESRIIPNVIEFAGWPYRRREALRPRLLWVRHLRAGYNPWMAVEVLGAIRQRYPEATLRMAGDGPMEAEMRRRLVREGVGGVELLGHLPLEALKRHYAECDVFINTTNVDNQPRSVLEAMACGLPVVSTDVGGLPYLINDRATGLLVPARDPEPMARAVFELLESPALGLQLADRAQELLHSFSWEVSRHKWAAVFTDLKVLSPPQTS